MELSNSEWKLIQSSVQYLRLEIEERLEKKFEKPEHRVQYQNDLARMEALETKLDAALGPIS